MSNETTETNEVEENQVTTEEATVETSPQQPTESLESQDNLELARELNITLRRDSVTNKPITPSTPAMRAALQRKAQNKPTVDDTTNIESMVLDTYGKLVAENPSIKFLVATLTEYVKRMGPNSSVTETRGGELQANLAGVFDVVLSLKPELAQIGLEIIVTVVKQNIKGAFQERLAFRFANTMPLNKELSIRFQLLTTLFITLASGTKKKDLAKALNIRQLHEYITDRTAKANLSEFIN